MKLFELDPNNPIDKELQRTSKNAATAGSLDQDDIDQQEDPMGSVPNEPEGAMGAMGDEESSMDAGGPEAAPTKPVDPTLMSKLQAHDYMQRYDHSDPDSATHPIMIMNKDMSELSQLRNQLRMHQDMVGVTDRAGIYSDPEVKASADMLSFVDQVMVHKKMAAKTDKTSKSQKPKVRQQPKPKTAAGKQFKAKRS